MNEYIFEFANTNESKVMTGSLGDAKKIERLLLQKPTFITGGGVNIRKYEFEQNNTTILTDIENDIMNQVSIHLPDIIINEIKVERRNSNSIIIGFSIGIDRPFIFGVVIPDNASLVSQIIY